MIVKSGVTLLLVVLLSGSWWGGGDTRRVHLDGWVFETCRAGQPVGPLAGVIVSQSLGPETTSTDADGHFNLQTRARAVSGDAVTLTFRSGEASHSYRFNMVESLARGDELPRALRTFTMSPPWGRFVDCE